MPVKPFKINFNHPWGKLSRNQRRWQGFISYLSMAFMSLWEPEAVDMVMCRELMGQFVETATEREA